MKIKRLSQSFVAVIAVASVSLLASCSSVSSIDAVATVNGTDITRADYEELAKLLEEAEIFTLTDGEVSAEDSRQLLLTMINAQVIADLLNEYDITVSDADRASFKEQLGQSGQLEGYPAALQDYVIGLYADQGALSNVDAIEGSALSELYNSAPGGAGVMCLRHLVVEEESTAEKALTEYNDGADFAELAGKYSTEQNAETTGGALRDTNNDNDCISVSQYQQQFDIDFVRGALTAMPGEVVGPIKSSFGWHLIEARSYDDVSESLAAIFTDNTGAALADAAMLNSDIRVDSSFGKWDAGSGTIIDL